MNLDELQSVQSRERQATSLQNLRPSFYQDASEFIQQLTRERDQAAERADDPFSSPEVRRLSDDIQTARQTVEALYERRVGKVVKMASIAAADMPTDDEGLTEEEAALFDALVARIEENREHVLDEVLDGEASEPPVSDGTTGAEPDADPTKARDEGVVSGTDGEAGDRPADATPGDPSPQETVTDREDGAVDAAGLMGAPDEEPAGEGSTSGGPGPGSDSRTEVPPGRPPGDEAASASEDDVDRTTVQVLRDVGEIFGVDERTYQLSADEVVTLPAANAEPLLERDAAERLE